MVARPEVSLDAALVEPLSPAVVLPASLTRAERRWLVCFAACLLITPFIGSKWRVGWPLARDGDQPHYLVMLNSLLEDGDLDLGNNYVASRSGSLDAGRSWAGKSLDNHTCWWLDGKRIDWHDVHEPPPGVAERPVHPAGLPAMLALLVWPLRGTPYIEAAAVLLIALATMAAMLLFHGLIRAWTGTTGLALAVTGTTFLGTPLWRYSRSIFTEAPLALCAIGAAYFILRRRNGWAAGGFVAAGISMKPPFLLIAIPLAAFLFIRKDRRSLLALAVPCVAATAGTLAMSAILYGSPWRSPQPFYTGNPIVGALGLLFETRHGLLFAAPVALCAVIGWPALWRRRPVESAVLLGAAGLWYALIACWRGWDGSACYGPRLIVPILPFVMAGLLGLDVSRPWIRRVAVTLGVISIGLNFVAASGWSGVTDESWVQAVMWEIHPKHR